MAEDPIKTSLEIDLTDESKEKIAKDVSDAVSEGLENKELDDKVSKIFSKKNIKDTFLKNMKNVFVDSEKQQTKQNALAKKFAEQQGNITKLISTQGKGFKGNAQLVGLIGKQAMTGLSGVATKINPIVLGVTIILGVIKETVKQLERIAKESAKFVGQGSIFTDKGTMDMMQKTGQTATQAQATNRSLGSMGLEFSDIQQGKITAEQAKLFEQLRLRELEKLEKINEVAGPMFKSLQQVTLGITLLMQDVNDWITMAFAAGPGIEKFIGSVKAMLGNIGPFIQSIIKFIVPIADVIMSVVSVVMDVLNAIIPILTYIFNTVTPIINIIMEFIGVLAKIIGPLVGTIGSIISIILKLMETFNVLSPILNGIAKLFGFVGDVVGKVFEWVGGIVAGLAGLLNSAIKMLKGINILGWKPFEGLEEIDVEGMKTNSSNANYTNETNNNYIYGSNDNSRQNNQNSNTDLFSNGYVLVND